MAVRPIPAASSYLSGPCNGFALSLAGAYPARTPVLGSRRPSGSTPERRRADHSEARIRSSDGADGGERIGGLATSFDWGSPECGQAQSFHRPPDTGQQLSKFDQLALRPTKQNLLIIRVTIDSGWHFFGLPSACPHPARKDIGMFYIHADPPKYLPPIPVRVSRRAQLTAALRQHARPIVIEDQELAGPFVRLLRARQLRLWGLGEFVANTMSCGIDQCYGANVEAHWYVGRYVLPGNVQKVILKPKPYGAGLPRHLQ